MTQLPEFIQGPAVKVQGLPRVGRVQRRPQHNFRVNARPFRIQPFMFAPVLPGETMKNLLVQAKVLTDPVAHPYLGWWFEMYYFYVKLRDLWGQTDPNGNGALVENMLIAGGNPPTFTGATNKDFMWTNGQGANWTSSAVRRCVETYFRSEEEFDEAVAYQGIRCFGADGVSHKAKVITAPGWAESLDDSTSVLASDGTPIPGDSWPDLPPHLSGFQAAYTEWQKMQSLQLVAPRFEDYLKTFGVHVPPIEKKNMHRPELIRYIRKFEQPKNTVLAGSVNSQVVWDVAERADKDRYFSEPGFIVGLAVARPKLYLRDQNSAMVNFLNTGQSWLPALLQEDPFTSLVQFTGGASGVGPLGSTEADNYWVDLADLFVHGDQFFNVPGTDPGFYSACQPDASKRILTTYAADADIDGVFKTPATANLVRIEGRVDLNILGRLADTTP